RDEGRGRVPEPGVESGEAARARRGDRRAASHPARGAAAAGRGRRTAGGGSAAAGRVAPAGGEREDDGGRAGDADEACGGLATEGTGGGHRVSWVRGRSRPGGTHPPGA